MVELRRVNVVIDDQAHQVLLDFQKSRGYSSKDKALAELLREFKDMTMDETNDRILKAMAGGKQMEINIILSRLFPAGDGHLDPDELNDRLIIMERKSGYVKTYEKHGAIHRAELTEFGRQYLRNKGEFGP